MAVKSFKMNKLIRDQIPAQMLAKGIIMHNRIMNKEEFIHKLKDKLLEECQEVNNSNTSEELLEELADVLEVIHALSSAFDLSIEQLEEKRIQKRNQKGGFEGRIFNHHVDIDENNPSITYLSQTKKYSQLSHDSHSCLFCQMAKQEDHHFAKFQHCYIIKDQFPVSPGHLLIIPYEHIENWFTASEEVRLDITKALHFAKQKLEKEFSPDGYNIGANCGEMAGQTIMHLHVHLIPRYKGDMENPKGGVRGVIPSKQKY